ncbi:MAG: formylglycine-generating enzyme family protein [Bernardetiaceae bacterium]
MQPFTLSDLHPDLPHFPFVWIPEGEFMMGSEDYDNEKPLHRVRLSGFWLSQFLATQELYLAVTGQNPSYFAGSPHRPVDQVSWDDARAFLGRLGEMTGKNFALPTEAQWEYAARAGEPYTYAGSDHLHEVGWYEDNAHRETKPVGLKKPNAWGLYDMSGNVWEWCQDRWSSDYYAECAKQGLVVDPAGPADGLGRVLRGGSWLNYAQYCRVAYRFNSCPYSRYSNRGFRLCLFP